MTEKREDKACTVVLGGGLTGLSAGCVLARAGHAVRVVERDAEVGGLSKTIRHGGFRFDLGGHRFFSNDEKLNRFVRDLMGDELITVARSSKILLRGRYFDYPLRPANAFFGLGMSTSLRVVADYLFEKFRDLTRSGDPVSLEDWVVRNFGRTMFNIYFKVYSEKVWGIDCSEISAEWVDRRISGLSLAKAVKNAFSRAGGRKIPTLVDEFFYPRLGIGRMSDRLREEIELRSRVDVCTSVEAINHSDCRIRDIVVTRNGRPEVIDGDHFISSLPITCMIKMLNPCPPQHILDAASKLRFRDLVVVAVMLDRKRVTDQTWIYIPEKNIPFGRMHEPTNWSVEMAPEGKTLLVIEYFSFMGDSVWNSPDEELGKLTVDNLARLGFIDSKDVSGSLVVRVPKAYPLFKTGYSELCEELYGYLERFSNLQVAGRSGMFRYYNMDHAIESGISAAENVIARNADPSDRARDALLAGCKE